MNLAEASTGRNNNLNLLRVLAALAVLLSHCFTLATGNSASEPGRESLGITLGDISVDVFFAISGFLVTKSIVNSASLRKYAVARCLRILPGLWAALLLTTVVICVWYSNGPASQYVGHADVWLYLVRNAVVVTGAVFGFAGAFTQNPYPYSVNASLWTLPLEVWMYITLAVAWVLALVAPVRRLLGFAGILRVLTVMLVGAAVGLDLYGHPSNSLRHASIFFLAATMFGWRERIVLDFRIFAAALAAIALATQFTHVAFELTYRLFLPYIVFYLAYVPAGMIRSFNRVGDYSYGLYIYAFPVQQMVVASVPGISVTELFCWATVVTGACAFVSWHLVEARAMAWRSKVGR